MIHDAATVLVLRDSTAGPEVFMVRRHAKSSFMANAWVYPGGRLDAADTRPEVLARIVGTPQLHLESATRTAGLYLAAIRETFEEAGILLARVGSEDHWIDLHARPQFAAYRAALHAQEASLSTIAAEEDLTFWADELVYFAHWITPAFESKRFDTFFFLAQAPQNQTPLHDAMETTDSFWITAAAALKKFDDDEIWLAPPTQRTLERLARFASVDEAFAASRTFVPPCILPHLLVTDDGPILLLPGDDDYPADDPDYALGTPVHGETRMVLRPQAMRGA